jgi:hypothetical protein
VARRCPSCCSLSSPSLSDAYNNFFQSVVLEWLALMLWLDWHYDDDDDEPAVLVGCTTGGRFWVGS